MKKIISQISVSITALLLAFANIPLPKTITIIGESNTVIENPTASSEFATPNPSPSSTPPDPELASPTSPDSESSNPTTVPAETFQFTSDLIIKAVNPGYTQGEQSNVGELIELQKTTDALLSLAGYSVRYVNSSGKSVTLLNFSENAHLAGESLLMRLARSPGSDQADATYMTTVAMTAGTIELWYNDLLIDHVCWVKKSDECYPPFDKNKPTTLVRNLATGDFEHSADHVPTYDAAQPSLIIIEPEQPEKPDSSVSPENPENPADPENPPTGLGSDDTTPTDEKTYRCQNLEFSEILSYYSDDASEQFIEVYNSSDQTVELSGCSLRYKKKTYQLAGELAADQYLTFYPSKSATPFSLTKNPTTSNLVELLDQDGKLVDLLDYPHGQKKGTTYAKFYDADGAELWQLTYAATPGLANTYQEFRSCPDGKTINLATGNCVKVTDTSSGSSAAADCPAGKYRNPLTGRCKNIEASSTEPKPCAEGYERNPDTNRCRKIVAENDGAGYALVPTTYSDQKTFVALGVVLLIVGLGVIYVVLQFRREIARAYRKIRQRLHHVLKHLLAGRIGFGRHK